MTVFLDRYNRPLRIVWRGITRVRLQDQGEYDDTDERTIKRNTMKQYYDTSTVLIAVAAGLCAGLTVVLLIAAII